MSELIAISALIGDRTAGKDMQDYIAMVLIWYATEQHAGAAAGILKENLSDQLSTIERLLDNQLTEK